MTMFAKKSKQHGQSSSAIYPNRSVLPQNLRPPPATRHLGKFCVIHRDAEQLERDAGSAGVAIMLVPLRSERSATKTASAATLPDNYRRAIPARQCQLQQRHSVSLLAG